MINGDLNEFLELVYLGRELWFLYDEKKYFLRPWYENNEVYLCLDIFTKLEVESFEWKSEKHEKNIENFFKEKIFNGKTFWEVEKEIEWVDY